MRGTVIKGPITHLLLDFLRWAFKGKSKLDQREIKNKHTSSPIWAEYNGEMIDCLVQRFIFWMVNTKINPNEKPWKINAWVWILLWLLFKLPVVYHVCFPFPSSGITPMFCSVSAAGPGTGDCREGEDKKSSTDRQLTRLPGRMSCWRYWDCCPALQLYREKLIQYWK